MAGTPDSPPGRGGWDRAGARAGGIVAWGAWGAMTVALLLFVRQYSRDIPYYDDFEMVPVATGQQPFTLRWAWAQHEEHRPVVSRLLMTGLYRVVGINFRAPRYTNAALLSGMSALMLLAARRLRGRSRAIDAVLPMAILSLAQVESLLIGFAMNLVLTTVLAGALIAAAGRARPDGRAATLVFGIVLVLLPLCGGSGLVMMPPLAIWLAGSVGWGWWSVRKPDPTTRALGAGLLLAALAVAALYLWDYGRPAHHPQPRSLASIASATLIYLSLAVYPHVSSYWWPASLIVVELIVATLVLLAWTCARSPEERPRAAAMIAVLLAMLDIAGAIGISRAGYIREAILASRYVTLGLPLFCVMYMAWLAYAKAVDRRAIHALLLLLAGLAMPDAYRFSRSYGGSACFAMQRVERALKFRRPAARVIGFACPGIYPNREIVGNYFRMLKEAQVGVFANYREDGVASKPAADGILRR